MVGGLDKQTHNVKRAKLMNRQQIVTLNINLDKI